MKFTDGYWMLREGVTAAHPVQALDVTTGPGTLEIHAPTHPVRHRGDLLKGPVVTVTAHAPMPGVIGVTFTHFRGAPRTAPTSPSPARTSPPGPPPTRSTRPSPPARSPSGCPAPRPGTWTSSPKAGS